MRSVGIHNIFNRTSIFEPIQDKVLNRKRNYVFKDSMFEVHIKGKYLNHTIDYPLFSLIIRHWRNNQADDEAIPENVIIPFSEIEALFQISGKGKKKSGFIKIENSLGRLYSNEFKFKYVNKKKNNVFSELKLFSVKPNFDFEDKHIELNISPLLVELYALNINIKYMNIEALCNIKGERNKAFFKYISTHKGVYMDHKLEKLSRILGLLERNYDEARCREYIEKSLKELVKYNFVRCYKWDKEKKYYRILQSKYYSLEEGEFLLKHATSNLNKKDV